ncbi:MAG TPA: hypothetical protein V6C69_01085 [Trichormus sp.]|jgi:hypothetical protein
MSETFSLYVVDEELLPTELIGDTDEEMYEQLVTAVESNGIVESIIEMTEDDFVDALESIDKLVEGNRLLPNNAMNHSPHELLGTNSDCPYFGYFSPAQVQELLFLFESLSDEQIDIIESVETHSQVFEAFRMAVEIALDHEHALAILHS